MEEWLNETDILETLGIEKINTAQLYNALEQLQESNFVTVESSIAQFFAQHEDKRSLIIDVTDTYFEGESIEEEPRRGKDGKVKHLIQIGLAVTEKNGFPIFHRIFLGNVSGKRMFSEMITSLVPLGFDGVVLDRGFYSAKNIDEALALKLGIICGVVKDKHFRLILLGLDKEALYQKANRVTLRHTHVYCTSIDYKSGKLVVVYNPYLEVVKKERFYDKGGEDEDAALLGFSLIYHNTDMADVDVVRKYFEKDVIERSFKQMKGVLSLRPVRVWLKSHVEAHIKICYAAYAILSLLEFKISSLGVSGVDALDILRRGYRVKLVDQKSGFEWDAIIELTKQQEQIRNLVHKS